MSAVKRSLGNEDGTLAGRPRPKEHCAFATSLSEYTPKRLSSALGMENALVKVALPEALTYNFNLRYVQIPFLNFYRIEGFHESLPLPN
jgi:hypothetical protein